MTTRGHAVFDTCNIFNGHAYGLGFHLDRLLQSAKAAKIYDDVTNPLPYSKEELQDIILATIAATGYKDGIFCRYWLSVGRGDFSISPLNLRKLGGKPSFYCVAHRDYASHRPYKSAHGLKACTTRLPLKPDLLASTKTTNYLINALIQMEAEENQCDLAIQIDENDRIYESAVSTIIMVDNSRQLVIPPPGRILESTTAKRAFALASTSLIKDNVLNGVSRREFTVREAKESSELFDLGGGWLRPIGLLDGHLIGGDGTFGPVGRALEKLLMDDMKTFDIYKF
eukprot:g4250.t1